MRFMVRLSMGANVLGFNGIVYLVVGDVPVDFFYYFQRGACVDFESRG